MLCLSVSLRPGKCSPS
ncbi:hypothetical protein [Pollutimonas nitritireducens]|nr:hypothetical protein [Pollutimonas nitritireducens]